MISWIFPMVGFFSNNFIDWNFLNTSSIRMTVWKNGKFPMENVGRANLFLTKNVENFWRKMFTGSNFCFAENVRQFWLFSWGWKMFDNSFLGSGKCSTNTFMEMGNVRQSKFFENSLLCLLEHFRLSNIFQNQHSTCWNIFDCWTFSKNPHSTCWNVFDSRTFTFLTIWHFQTLTF